AVAAAAEDLRAAARLDEQDGAAAVLDGAAEGAAAAAGPDGQARGGRGGVRYRPAAGQGVDVRLARVEPQGRARGGVHVGGGRQGALHQVEVAYLLRGFRPATGAGEAEVGGAVAEERGEVHTVAEGNGVGPVAQQFRQRLGGGVVAEQDVRRGAVEGVHGD